jgi:hypothetical protein
LRCQRSGSTRTVFSRTRNSSGGVSTRNVPFVISSNALIRGIAGTTMVRIARVRRDRDNSSANRTESDFVRGVQKRRVELRDKKRKCQSRMGNQSAECGKWKYLPATPTPFLQLKRCRPTTAACSQETPGPRLWWLPRKPQRTEPNAKRASSRGPRTRLALARP